jgi:hypothetical protein
MPAQVRQGAALLLRRKIAKHWNKVPSQMKEAMKSGLLELVVGESEYVVSYQQGSLPKRRRASFAWSSVFANRYSWIK